MLMELKMWNASLDDWISSSGNMKLMVGYSSILWPQFKLLDGCIVHDSVTASSLKVWRDHLKGDLRGVEGVVNHRHLADIHSDDQETTLDRIKYMMPVLKEIYEAKLKWQFPDRPCVVSLIYPDDEGDLVDYQITFWQLKHENGAQQVATANDHVCHGSC